MEKWGKGNLHNRRVLSVFRVGLRGYMSDSIFYRYFLCRMWHVQGVDVFAAFGLCRGILLPSFILDSRCGSSFVSFLEQNSQKPEKGVACNCLYLVFRRVYLAYAGCDRYHCGISA